MCLNQCALEKAMLSQLPELKEPANRNIFDSSRHRPIVPALIIRFKKGAVWLKALFFVDFHPFS